MPTDDPVVALAQGHLNGTNGILVLTESQIVFVPNKAPVQSCDLNSVIEFRWLPGKISGKLVIKSPTINGEVTNILKHGADVLVSATTQRLPLSATQPAPAPTPPVAAPTPVIAAPEPAPPLAPVPVPTRVPDPAPMVAAPAASKPNATIKTTPSQSYGRADVDQAAERMGWKLGSKREVRKLVEHLWDGETVERLVGGTYGGGTGILALTDRRMIFLKDGWTHKTVEDFPLDKVSSVQWSSGMLTGSIMIFVSGNKSAVTNVQKDPGKALADDVRARISGVRQRPDATPVQAVAQPAEPAADPMAVLERLAQLHSAGILSDDEFAAKKAEILKRL